MCVRSYFIYSDSSAVIARFFWQFDEFRAISPLAARRFGLRVQEATIVTVS
jgi:hypothetical protein